MQRTVMNGYSDRINHALAFAAKHHDQQVRRGTRPPYSTQSANLAVMLTRYGCDEDTVTAGILLDVRHDDRLTRCRRGSADTATELDLEAAQASLIRTDAQQSARFNNAIKARPQVPESLLQKAA